MNNFLYRPIAALAMVSKCIPCLFFVIPILSFAQQSIVVNPKVIQYGGYRHKELPQSLLQRIEEITDTFEYVDGISYAQAVDMYKRDINPEEDLVLMEEMAKAYKSFCRARCMTAMERTDVYRLLLLRTMFDDIEALRRSDLKVLKYAEAQAAMKLYRLQPKPIQIIQFK